MRSTTIPPEIGTMTRLSQLFLYSSFKGVVPLSFTALTGVSRLWLGSNQFSGGLPAHLGTLTNLVDLSIYNIPTLTPAPLPASYYQLTALTSLELSLNKLTSTLSPQISNLQKLQYLSMNSNQFNGGIPTEIGLMTSLVWLQIGSNPWGQKLPTEIGKLTALTQLYLGSSQITGRIPSQLGLISPAAIVSLSSNLFTGK
jgi:Leucine-rich repeat (LRR) protein